MIRTTMSMILALVFASVLALPNVLANEKCTQATLEGSYGDVRTGTLRDRGLATAVGLWTFDGHGNYSAAVTNVFEDTGVLRTTFTGTYIVNPDCTGSLEIQGGPLADIAIVDAGREFRYVATRPNIGISTGPFRKQSLKECTNATLEGRYGLNFSGKIRDRGVVGGAGFLTFDGSGGVSYAATSVFEDTGVEHVTLEGTYTVSTDCTGSSLLGASATFDFVIVGDGEEVLQVATRSDRVVTWTLKKQ